MHTLIVVERRGLCGSRSCKVAVLCFEVEVPRLDVFGWHLDRSVCVCNLYKVEKGSRQNHSEDDTEEQRNRLLLCAVPISEILSEAVEVLRSKTSTKKRRQS